MSRKNKAKQTSVETWLNQLTDHVLEVWPSIQAQLKDRSLLTESFHEADHRQFADQPPENLSITTKTINSPPLIRFSRSRLLTVAASLILVAAIVLLTLWLGPANKGSVSAIALPSYPERTKFSFGANPNQVQRVDESYLQAIQNFSIRSAQKVLLADDSRNNALYSPLSLWYALSMCADSAAGQTRQEILKVLALADVSAEIIDTQAKRLFQLQYFDNDIGWLKIMNSIWLDKDIPFKANFLRSLSDDYYASLTASILANHRQPAKLRPGSINRRVAVLVSWKICPQTKI
jgi:hypothetical protein